MFDTKPFWKAVYSQKTTPQHIEERLSDLYVYARRAKEAWDRVDWIQEYFDIGSSLFRLVYDYDILRRLRSRANNIKYGTQERSLALVHIYKATGNARDRNRAEDSFDSIKASEFGGFLHSQALAELYCADIDAGRLNDLASVYRRVPKDWYVGHDKIFFRAVSELCLFPKEVARARGTADKIKNDRLRAEAYLEIFHAYADEDDFHKARKIAANVQYYVYSGFGSYYSADRACLDIAIAAAHKDMSVMPEYPEIGAGEKEITRFLDETEEVYSREYMRRGLGREALRSASSIQNPHFRARAFLNLVKQSIITLSVCEPLSVNVCFPVRDAGLLYTGD